MKKWIKFILGITIVAFSFNLFCVPDNLASTGIGGLSIVINNFIKIDTSLFVGVVNIFLIILSFIFLGKDDTYKTILGALIYPVMLKLTSYITCLIDLSSIDLLIKAIIGGIINGVGLGMVFKTGYTTGGTDIIESILGKYLKISMDKAIIMVDGVVVALTGLVFGVEHLIYAFVILIFQSIYSNQFMLGIKEDKILYINSHKNKEIRKFLSETYNYGITILKGRGGYSNRSNDILVVSIKSKFYLEIKEVILLIDNKAFITVCDSYETVYVNKEERKNKKKSNFNLEVN